VKILKFIKKTRRPCRALVETENFSANTFIGAINNYINRLFFTKELFFLNKTNLFIKRKQPQG
jgi:hypothetical protein